MAIDGLSVGQESESGRHTAKNNLESLALYEDGISQHLPSVPRGWIWTSAEEICSNKVSSGGTPTGHLACEGEIPFLKVGHLTFSGALDFRKDCAFVNRHTHEGYLKKSQVRPGDVLMNIVGPPLGKVSIVPDTFPAWNMNQAIVFFRMSEAYSNQLFCYWLLSKFASIFFKAESKATAGQHNVRTSVCRKLPVPLPPFNEQRRIVARIEELTARSKSAKESLQAIPPLLEKFRQSVLAAAFRGDLTAAWRRQNPDVEPAEVLLERIRVERRKRWEESGARGKYVEPEPVDASGLPELPRGWCWASLSALTQRIGDVDHRMPKPVFGPDSFPYISTKDFTPGGIDFGGAKRISKTDFDAISRKIRPELGDLLISRYGTIGAVREITTDIGFLASYSIAIVKTLRRSLNQLLVMTLQSPLLKSQMASETRATAQPDLGLESIRRLAIPVAPEAEQERITLLLESHLSLADFLASQVMSSQHRIAEFDKSILSKAFRGELVPQDPADEPASTLLARIRAERTQHPPSRQKRK